MNTLKATSLKGIAVVGAAAFALTGCSSDSKKDASDATSKVTSAASSAASAATGASTSASSPAASTTSPSVSSSPTSSSPSASTSDASGAATTPSHGGQAMNATVAKLGLEVPKGWVVVNQTTAKDQATLAKLEPLSKKQGVTPEKLVQSVLRVADVMAFNPEASSAMGESINVGKVTVPTLPTEALYKKELSAIGATLGKYERITTPAGPGVEESYSMSANGMTAHGLTIAVPNGQGSYSAVAITTTDAAKTAKYAKDVVASLDKL